MTGTSPEYGETPITYDEVDALVPRVREILGDPILKADIYDLEQTIEEEVREDRTVAVLEGRLELATVLTDWFVRELHRDLYGDIWRWAGILRKRELSIGVAPDNLSAELRRSLDSLLYRGTCTQDWTAREFGIAVHADLARIHPFVDGNGRTTRLLAELVLMAADDSPEVCTYDWSFDKTRYIDLLRSYDQNRDPAPLAAFVPVVTLIR